MKHGWLHWNVIYALQCQLLPRRARVLILQRYQGHMNQAFLSFSSSFPLSLRLSLMSCSVEYLFVPLPLNAAIVSFGRGITLITFPSITHSTLESDSILNLFLISAGIETCPLVVTLAFIPLSSCMIINYFA